MSNGRSNILELSYARTSGTAGADVPGEVTSRRDRAALARRKALKQQQEDENKASKQRAEDTKKFLKDLWKQEKKRRREEGDKGDEEQPPEDEEEEEPGGWVQVPDERPESPPRTAMRREEPRPLGGHMDRGLTQPKPAAPPKPVDAKTAARRAALRGAFGDIGDEEEDARQEMRRAEMERIRRTEERTRRSAAASVGAAPTGDDDAGRRNFSENPRDMSVRSAAAAASGSSDQADMYAIQKRLAEFKRSCKGKRVPMPEDIKADLAALQARTGHQFEG
eukprot:gnl/TRDRNA2_/TRDRNA2_136742_c0_seq1.p1 gnl/TRDRNA2_/TRDRNA2_136742_c0~~gnl/TRDRNA2_/TRDRNA2_136742_c0_seq1.p1  ORF type:complete len:279 (+),score=68.97 gnl/TRDRNA2_/TRDRNA2_136742_c0_seq1:144-980(+)